MTPVFPGAGSRANGPNPARAASDAAFDSLIVGLDQSFMHALVMHHLGRRGAAHHLAELATADTGDALLLLRRRVGVGVAPSLDGTWHPSTRAVLALEHESILACERDTAHQIVALLSGARDVCTDPADRAMFDGILARRVAWANSLEDARDNPAAFDRVTTDVTPLERLVARTAPWYTVPRAKSDGPAAPDEASTVLGELLPAVDQRFVHMGLLRGWARPALADGLLRVWVGEMRFQTCLILGLLALGATPRLDGRAGDAARPVVATSPDGAVAHELRLATARRPSLVAAREASQDSDTCPLRTLFDRGLDLLDQARTVLDQADHGLDGRSAGTGTYDGMLARWNVPGFA